MIVYSGGSDRSMPGENCSRSRVSRVGVGGVGGWRGAGGEGQQMRQWPREGRGPGPAMVEPGNLRTLEREQVVGGQQRA